MTGQEYNENLKRYHKAMDWYNAAPPAEQQEKHLSNFEKLLNKLEQGVSELKPSDHEKMNGLNLGGEAD